MKAENKFMTKRNYKGSLQLDWINKNLSLYYEIDEKEGRGIRPVWVQKNDIRVAEPRILRFIKNYGDATSENMLIKGDNLLVLRSLVEMFKGRTEKERVKCIYIAPPYNSGNAFEHYDDNLKHSEWLTMMRDRLRLLKKLLRKDGIIFVQISEDEFSYLKCLMDEIFGRDKYLSTIVVKTKSGAGVGQESFLMTINEYILVYASTDKKLVENYQKYIEAPIDESVTDTYNLVLESTGKEKPVKVIKGSRVGEIKVFSHTNFKIVKLAKTERTQKNYYKHFEKVFRTTNPQGGLMQRIMPQLPKTELVSIEHMPSKGRHAGKVHRSYFYKNALIVWLHDTAIKDTKNKTANKLEKNSSFWDENLWQGIDPEGGVKFPQSKKPERLIERILGISTKENDLVLDSFAGSGTTGAVAHKMRRKWLMVEIGKHTEEKVIPRLHYIIAGKDQSGISKSVSWNGGGGFKYYQLGDSIIHEQDMNWKLKAEEMAEAVFLHFQYRPVKAEWLEKENMYLGRHQSARYHFALSFASREIKTITEDLYEKIVAGLDKEKFKHLTIFTNVAVAVPPDSFDKERILVKKIPAAILREYNLL